MTSKPNLALALCATLLTHGPVQAAPPTKTDDSKTITLKVTPATPILKVPMNCAST